VKTGLADLARNSSHLPGVTQIQQAHVFGDYLRMAYVYLEKYMLAAAYRVPLFVVRLLVLCLCLPLFALAAFVGLVDGLVRRDLRRFGAGRESGFIYHRARASLMPLVILPWVSYLVMPFSMHPLWMLLPFALVLGLAVNLAAGSFNNYL